MLNDECRVRVSGCSSPALNGSKKKKKKALSDRCFDLDFTIFFFLCTCACDFLGGCHYPNNGASNNKSCHFLFHPPRRIQQVQPVRLWPQCLSGGSWKPDPGQMVKNTCRAPSAFLLYLLLSALLRAGRMCCQMCNNYCICAIMFVL